MEGIAEQKVLLSPFLKHFLSYNKSYLDISEGTTGSGKTVGNIIKFIDCVYESKYKFHIISCRSIQKTEQNVVNDDTCGMVTLYDGLVRYYPHGHGSTSTRHLSIKGRDGNEKIIHFISYSDSAQWEAVRGGRFGCSFVDEVNEVPGESPDVVPRFISEVLSRTNEHVFFTLNPDDPDKPIYKIINKARPVEYYKYKGHAEIRRFLTLPENKKWKWWFWTFEDNLTMTEELIQIAKDGCEGNEREYNSRILGLRCKTEALAFPGFDDRCILSDEKIQKQFKIYTDENGNKVQPKKKFIGFYAGVDTAYSHNTDDLIALMFCGLTDKGELYVLDEWTWNNNEHIEQERMTAHLLQNELKEFLQKNSKKWGYPMCCFIDEADSSFRTELTVNPIEGFYTSKTLKSKFPIETRMRLIKNLISQRKYFVNENCTMHIHEMSVMATDKKNKSRPEDRNNHTYDAMCYAIEKWYLEGRITA